MRRINLRKIPKIFIFSLVTSGLLLGTASCVPDGESDLLQSLWEQTDSIGGEMTFTTKDGEKVTVTITKNSDAAVVNEEENNSTEQEDKQPEEKTSDCSDLNDFLPSLNCIEDVFKTLGVWEKAAELRKLGHPWSHVAAEIGYTEDTMYGHLYEIIKQNIHQAWELGLISEEKYEYKLKYYGDLALKWVDKIFADVNPTTSATLEDFLPSLNCIEDVFRTLGVWEDAHVLYDEVQSWSKVAEELGYTADVMYAKLKEIIEKDLHQAKVEGLITYEQYQSKISYYNELALKWVGEIFSS
jgi:hypothetical protein